MAKFMRRMQQQYVQRQHCNSSNPAATLQQQQQHGSNIKWTTWSASIFLRPVCFWHPVLVGSTQKRTNKAAGRYFPSFFPGRWIMFNVCVYVGDRKSICEWKVCSCLCDVWISKLCKKFFISRFFLFVRRSSLIRHRFPILGNFSVSPIVPKGKVMGKGARWLAYGNLIRF